MVKTIFSTYPLPLLKQVWDELVLLGEIDIPWLMPKVEEPVQKPALPQNLPYRRPILKVLLRHCIHKIRNLPPMRTCSISLL